MRWAQWNEDEKPVALEAAQGGEVGLDVVVTAGTKSQDRGLEFDLSLFQPSMILSFFFRPNTPAAAPIKNGIKNIISPPLPTLINLCR